jgi:hypothetical protein
MIKRILWATALFAVVGSGAAFAQDSPSDVHGKVSKTIATEASAQQKADDWNYEKTTTIDSIRDLKYRITWKQYRQKKYQVYIEGVKENIKILQEKKEELNKLREQLDPYLESVVDRLEAFIKKDMPFLPEERARRIDNLRGSLNNYNLALSEKLNRIFSIGLKVEAEYGKMIESQEDVALNLGGTETKCTVIRLGRIAMYYMSIDGNQIGMWNQKTAKWEPVSDDQQNVFKSAFDMALAKKAAEVVELPITGAI